MALGAGLWPCAGARRQSVARRAVSLMRINKAVVEPHLKSVGALSSKPLQKGTVWFNEEKRKPNVGHAQVARRSYQLRASVGALRASCSCSQC